MNKRELDLLEKAFSAEIDGALSKSGIRLFQTRSKLAQKLVADGLLREVELNLPGRFPVTLRGYELTQLGNAMYCMSDLCAERAAL